jgi:hypothetical protein
MKTTPHLHLPSRRLEKVADAELFSEPRSYSPRDKRRE